ncbi:unnamed protein product, partial [Lymnaea stagnalis]
MPGTADASNPLGDSNQPRASVDPYAFPPNTPQTQAQQDDPFISPGPLTPDPFNPGRQRGDMYPGGSPQMRPPLTPTSIGPGQGSPYPGSPVRMSDPTFRHPLVRSNSLPDPYNMQMGTPRPQMDQPMHHPMGEVGPDTMQMFRGGRMPMQLSEDGGENPGNIHHQQLRVILGQQTKQRMAKKQEEAERMMTGPSSGWQDGPETIEGFPPRPPFRGPSPHGFMRGPQPGMNPQGPRPPFFPNFMPRQPLSEQYVGSPQEAMIADQRTPYHLQMSESPGPPGTPIQGPLHMVNLPPYPSAQTQQQQQQPMQQPPLSLTPSGVAGEGHPSMARHVPASQQSGEDEIFSGPVSPQASTSKTPVPEDSTAVVEPDTLLEGIDEKGTKPSLSSEEDKNEDDDLLKWFSPGADGTFDILKYADPDLDLDLDDKMFEHLDFIDESHAGDPKKSDQDKSDDVKDEVKEEKDGDGSKTRSSADFQAQFLEFSQKQKSEANKDKEDGDAMKTAEEKEKEKTEVGQIAAMLQGTEAMTARLTGGDSSG